MPAKNRTKQYVEDGCYHIYNRGVEKRTTFKDRQDFTVFLHFLKLYLSPLEGDNSQSNLPIRIKKTFFGEIELLAFCLMPNHFHLLVHQNNQKAISNFMKALCTSYVMYFNKKYKRVGSLFQGNYKAVLVIEDDYLLHLSRYIHCNPLKSFAGSDPAKLAEYPYSSYSNYLGKRKASWVNTDFVSSILSQSDSFNPNVYRKFVEDYLKKDDVIPKQLLIEDEDE